MLPGNLIARFIVAVQSHLQILHTRREGINVGAYIIFAFFARLTIGASRTFRFLSFPS
jgi:hypothetical protein